MGFGDELPIERRVPWPSRCADMGWDPTVFPAGRRLRGHRIRAASQAAVALCVDLSFSMVHDGRWGPMKQTALALNQLIETRFRQDALQVIGFNRLARRLTPVQLAEAEPEWTQGTNLQHASLLALRHVRRHPDAEPVVLVVTDGEPTAHLTGGGEAHFNWPTTSETCGHDRRGGRAHSLRRDDQHLHAGRRSGARLALSMRWPGGPGAGSSRPTYLASESTWSPII